MTSAYVLIIAMLVLGGVIAVLGDRLGTKIGKARLRVFNLRPKHTAVLMTVVTGTTIAATTLGILFALSESLRDGVFRLDDILSELRTAQGDLEETKTEKTQVEKELGLSNQEKSNVEKGLKQIQSRFQRARQQAEKLQKEVTQLRGQRETLVKQIPQLQGQVRERDRALQARERAIKERDLLIQTRDYKLREKEQSILDRDQRIKDRDRTIFSRERKIAERDQTIAVREGQIRSQESILREREGRLRQLQQQRDVLQTEISQRDRRIQDLDQSIATRDETLREREKVLADLGGQLQVLQGEVTALEEDYQKLRVGDVAITRGEVLSFGVVRILEPNAAQVAIDELLRQANRKAFEATRRPIAPNETVKERVVLISQEEVEQVINQIKDGHDYVVRLLSAGNYVADEKFVRVFADVALNEQVFGADEVIATVSIEQGSITPDEVRERLDNLLAATQFRARRAGVVGSIQVGDGNVATLISFLEHLGETGISFDQLQAIALEQTYIAGPLKIKLVALSNGAILFSS